MNETFFSDRYPQGYEKTIDPDQYGSLVEIFDEYVANYWDHKAYSCLGKTITFADLKEKSAQFACFLQNELKLKKGDRMAVQLPNILQYPIVVFGAMRAGVVIVNTNPLYTEHEMEHQFNDSEATALVVLANMADKAQAVVPKTKIKHVIVTEVADIHNTFKRILINGVLKYVKKEVPHYDIPNSYRLRDALKIGASGKFEAADIDREDIAVLQYTGGTTGVAKGAMLTHRNLIANMLQCSAVLDKFLDKAQEEVIAPLPLYHIYAFTVHCMVIARLGNHTILIPNPRDLDGFIKTLKKVRYTAFIGLNTLFVGLCNRADFRELDHSELKITVSGGMALTSDAAERWKEVTGSDITEGYGMTETSPVVTLNPIDRIKLGTIGMPLPSTLCKTIDEQGNETEIGEPGELCAKGPQVMKGYLNRPEETAECIDEDGWIKTGDVAVISDDGYIKIVDRKKDMIIVSGFNVYPNEVEDAATSHPDIVEAAAIGVPDEKTSEAVKLFVVSSNPNLTAKEVIKWCREDLTAYKVPRQIEFRDELPKTNVGKVLRRELRDS